MQTHKPQSSASKRASKHVSKTEARAPRAARHQPWLGVAAAGVLGLAAWSSAGCLFLPDIAKHGYVACERAADCAPDRACVAELCVPPPWREPDYTQRQTVLVKNNGDTAIPAGTPYPIRVGETGDVSLEAMRQARLSTYAADSETWTDQVVHQDLYDDRYTLWVPLPTDVPAGQSRPLTWLEQKWGGEENAPGYARDSVAAFEGALIIEDFGDGAVAPSTDDWRISGTPRLFEGGLLIEDNQEVTRKKALQQPFSLQFFARANGVNCENVFIGVKGEDVAGDAPPAASFAIGAGLQAQLETWPTADAQRPERNQVNTNVGTIVHEFRIDVGGGKVRYSMDGEELGTYADDRAPVADTPMYFYADVDGACSVNIERVWALTWPYDAPEIVLRDPVPFVLF